MAKNSGIVALLALTLVAGSMMAGDKKSHSGWVKGTLIDEDGKPYKGAVIRAEPKGKTELKGKAFVTATDSRGEYLFTAMPIGDYSITAYIDGVALSRALIRTSDRGWTNLNFDLRLNATGADGADRMQRDIRFSNRPTFSGGHAGGW